MSGERIDIEGFADLELRVITDAAIGWAEYAEPFLVERLRAADQSRDRVGGIIAIGAVLEAYIEALASDSPDCRTPERGRS